MIGLSRKIDIGILDGQPIIVTSFGQGGANPVEINHFIIDEIALAIIPDAHRNAVDCTAQANFR